MARLLLLLFAWPMLSQPTMNPLQQKITKSIGDYFKLDRENIHLHLNKNKYLSQESIWFTGYVIEKKNKPTFQTTNVFVELTDEDGKKIASQLLFAENNVFSGYLRLDQKLPSDQYYVHVYTNYMNNFSEDESSSYPIAIFNPDDKNYPADSINYDAVTLGLFPESGVFLSDISNTFGASLTDCNGIGIPLSDIAINDKSGNTVTRFATDAHGFGKFEIVATPGETYTASFIIKDKKHEQPLPAMVAKGIAFSATNYLYPDKVIVNVKTNQATRGETKKPYILVFQQNEVCTFVDFTFAENASEQRLVIPSTSIPEGINAMFLIDQNLQKIGERLLYNPRAPIPKALLNAAIKRSDSIVIKGSVPIASGILSISILPDYPATNSHQDILADFGFNNLLPASIRDAHYYTSDFSRRKHYEFDNLLLTQKPKYDWSLMMNPPPTAQYSNDIGLTIKGRIITSVDRSAYRVNLNSLNAGLNEYADIGEKSDFTFENILVPDSTKIYFPLTDKIGKSKTMPMSFVVLNTNRKFLKPFTGKPGCVSSAETTESKPAIALPKITDAIALDSISILNKKSKLSNRNKPGNMMARGFKITETEVKFYRNVLEFIESNGFDVNLIDGEWTIQSYFGRRRVRLRQGELDNKYVKYNSPALYWDGVLQQSADIFRSMGMETIDEIYIRRDGTDLTVPGSVGIVKVYSKKTFAGFDVAQSDKSAILNIKDGFQKYRPYQNPKYASVKDQGFMQLGTIDWKPLVETDAKGTFHFSIPNLNQKSVRVIVEGMSADGQMVSEILTLDLP